MSKAAELANLIGNINAGGGGVNRNLIINGAMNVSQRGTSHSFAHDVTTNAYTLDRFFLEMSGMDELDLTVTQDSSVPSGQGFSNSMKVDITTAESTLASDEFVRILQKIEAQNLQVLNYGTSDAKTTTLSFWVKSNLTGAFAVSMYEADGNRIIGSTYTISSANTWEKKTITFVGDTGGTINDDNGEGFWLNFCLATGSDRTGTANSSWGAFANAKLFNGQVANITSSASNDFYLTGVQLEIGQNATEFEHEPFETTLAKCQRYFQYLPSGAVGRWNSSTECELGFNCPSVMRATPSNSINPNDNTANIFRMGIAVNACTISAVNAVYMSPSGGIAAITVSATASTPSAGNMAVYDTNGDSEVVFLDSEL